MTVCDRAKQSIKRRTLGESGQSLIEMALILPILALMLAGVVDLGRGIRASIVVLNAAEVGARYGMRYPSDASGIQSRVQSAVTGTDVTVTSVGVTYPSGNAAGNPIQVQVTYQFSALFGQLLGQSTFTVRRSVQAPIL